MKSMRRKGMDTEQLQNIKTKIRDEIEELNCVMISESGGQWETNEDVFKTIKGEDCYDYLFSFYNCPPITVKMGMKDNTIVCMNIFNDTIPISKKIIRKLNNYCNIHPKIKYFADIALNKYEIYEI